MKYKESEVLCQITFKMARWKTLCKSLIRKGLPLYALLGPEHCGRVTRVLPTSAKSHLNHNSYLTLLFTIDYDLIGASLSIQALPEMVASLLSYPPRCRSCLS
jgi:hypothetical protein